MQRLYDKLLSFPVTTILVLLIVTVFFSLQISKLRWETDARTFFPHGHPAIVYDEKIDEIFGVKDSIIIGIVNEEKGIFNPSTLKRIARITEKVSSLKGVIAHRKEDVASLSTATLFISDGDSMGVKHLMDEVPQSEKAIKGLKESVYRHSDIFVGNIVSSDGTAAMIRAKIKEGIANRYWVYYQVKGILQAEQGIEPEWSGEWGGEDGQAEDESQGWGGEWNKDGGQEEQGSPKWGNQWNKEGNSTGQESPIRDNPLNVEDKQTEQEIQKSDAEWGNAEDNGDTFYIAGRPVMEVTSGLYAMEDIRYMVPLVILAIVIILFIIFRSIRGILLPIFVVIGGIIWTLGLMAIFNVPLYIISTMMPVILIAVGSADGIHILSNYYDQVSRNPNRGKKETVIEVMREMWSPVLMTSLTTSAGFLSLLFAEMIPFKSFGLFTAVGIMSCWILSITLLPAVLTVCKQKGWTSSRASRTTWMDRLFERFGGVINRKRGTIAVLTVIALIASIYGLSRLYVDSSWLDDFKEDSEVALSNRILNEKFDGTVFLNVVVEGNEKDAIKSPELLRKMEGLQKEIGGLEHVGSSRSVVDYIKGMNKTLHGDDEEYKVIPDSKRTIAEYLFLYSISGRPHILDEVIDYDYRTANISFSIKTDHTRDLKNIIDATRSYIDQNFDDTQAKLDLAGSANNSYIWADLLIQSQRNAIVLSKIGVFIVATLIFRSLIAGIFNIIPITITTVLVFGFMGLLGIPLDVSTALASGLGIGIGIDYTIHYISRYRNELNRRGDHQEATTSTMASTGKAIFFNAVVVTIGFLVLSASQFPPHTKLGYFAAVYMIASFWAALISLPILFSLMRPGFLRKAPTTTSSAERDQQ